MDDRANLPLVIAVSSNLMDLARFESAASRLGYRMEGRSASELEDAEAVIAFVDLEGDDSADAITTLAGRGIRVIAFGPHVDDMAMVRARTLGAKVAEPRSRVFRDPGAYLPPLV